MDYSQIKPRQNNTCLICGSKSQMKMGIRGNREYSGAVPDASPHITTNIVQCKNCGFIYTDPLLEGAELLEKEHYSTAKTYKTANTESIIEMFHKRLEIIQKIKPKGSVLDVGSGKGELLHCLKENGYEIFGIEPSEGLAKFAKEQYNVQSFIGTIEHFKPDKKFDIITSLHSLEHMDAPHNFILNAKELINEKGILLIEVPNTESYFLKIIDFYFRRIKRKNWSSRLSPLHPPFHKYGYNKKSLKFLLHKHGFKIIQTNTLHGADRGYEDKASVSKLLKLIRKLISVITNLSGNKEIILVVAQKAN